MNIIHHSQILHYGKVSHFSEHRGEFLCFWVCTLFWCESLSILLFSNIIFCDTFPHNRNLSGKFSPTNSQTLPPPKEKCFPFSRKKEGGKGFFVGQEAFPQLLPRCLIQDYTSTFMLMSAESTIFSGREIMYLRKK